MSFRKRSLTSSLRSLTGSPPSRRTTKDVFASNAGTTTAAGGAVITSSVSYSSGSESDTSMTLSSSDSSLSSSNSISRSSGEISAVGASGEPKLSNRDKIKRQLSWRSSSSRVKKEQKEKEKEKNKSDKGDSGDKGGDVGKDGRKRSTTKIFKSDKEMKEGKLENLRQAGETAYDSIASSITDIERNIEKRQKIDDQLKEKVKEMSLYIHRFSSVTITTTATVASLGSSPSTAASNGSSSSSPPPFVAQSSSSNLNKTIQTSTSYRILPTMERVNSAVWESLEKVRSHRLACVCLCPTATD
jgi:hypothetical protein